MSSGQPDARRLVAEVVDSFEKLEIVVYVHRSISLPLAEVEVCVQALQARHVLEPNGPWATSVAALVEMYDKDRIEILNLITRAALARVQKQTASVFADAFLLRKKKGDPDG
jgi:hypothetical protein